MDATFLILSLFFLIIELAYLVSCFIVIIRIIKYRRQNSNNRTITVSTLIFLAACILGSIMHNIPSTVGKIGTPIFVLFLIVEILYLLIITLVALRSQKLRLIFGALLIAGLIFIPFLALREWNDVTYDPLFAYESLIATSISFAYFLQLGDEIKTINVLKNPVTLLMLGLFFCYSLPFAYNTTMATINLLDPDFYPSIQKSFKDRMLLLFVSRVGTVCYLIFNIFIYKAFECKTQIPVGISS